MLLPSNYWDQRAIGSESDLATPTVHTHSFPKLLSLILQHRFYMRFYSANVLLTQQI